MSWLSPVDGPIPAPIYGAPDADGFPTVTGFEPGYRLNIPPQLMLAELEPFRVGPAPPPLRVFAGDDPAAPETVFLLFDDEAAARASALGVWWLEAAS